LFAVLQSFRYWKLLLKLYALVNLGCFDGWLFWSFLTAQKRLIPRDRLRGRAVLSD
jgi:hypothetical protein